MGQRAPGTLCAEQHFSGEELLISAHCSASGDVAVTPDAVGARPLRCDVAASAWPTLAGPGRVCGLPGQDYGRPGQSPERAGKRPRMSVYRVTEVIGVSTESWEAAARTAIETAAGTVRELRIAEVVRQDVTIEDGQVTGFRVRLAISFKYDSES